MSIYKQRAEFAEFKRNLDNYTYEEKMILLKQFRKKSFENKENNNLY